MSGIRLLDTSLNRLVVVDPSSGRSWADVNGDGKIDASDALSGPANETVQLAAGELQRWFLAPVPGSTTPGSSFVVAGVASPRELTILGDGGSIAAGRSKLAQHLDFFDDNGDGRLSPAEIFRGFRRLGMGVAKSFIRAALSALIFGGLKNHLQVDIDAIGSKRYPSSTGIYDSDGNINETKLSEFLAEFEKKGGTLTERELGDLLEKKSIGTVSKRQFGTLASACYRINGTRTVTSQQFIDLFQGSLLWQVASLPNDRGQRGL